MTLDTTAARPPVPASTASTADGYDAVVIGAGPNGLVAANDLADHGWRVLVLEAQPEPGGAVRSDRTLHDGYVGDRFSAFYPLGAVSPHLRRLDLAAHGLQWSHAPVVLANPTPDGPAVLLHRDHAATAASLDRFAPGDGAQWQRLQDSWERIEAPLIDALMGPFPPLRPTARLVRALGVRRSGDLARTALLPVRRMAEEHFAGAGAGLLLAGCALHADLTPDSALSGFFGWMLAAIGQGHGWPVVRNGAGELADALARRLVAKGGALRCGEAVTRIEVAGGRAVAVHTARGERVAARRAVLADVVAPQLYGRLLDEHDVPDRVLTAMRRYQRGGATFKVNWALDRPVPWRDPSVAGAGTVHLADSFDELTVSAAQLAMGYVPHRPFVLAGQMTTADPTRSPAGTEALWAYTNVPQTVRGDAAGLDCDPHREDDAERFADRIQARIEEAAPGFTSSILRRTVQTPASMQREDANLVGGDKSLGTAQLHQQLIFRPTVGSARPSTAIAGLFLASASAHPGGGVHGACGANAARAAIAADRLHAARKVITRR